MMTNKKLGRDAPNVSVTDAIQRLQKAIDLLNSRDWSYALKAAFHAERRGCKAKDRAAGIEWMTVANLIIVANDDATPYLMLPERPQPDDGYDIPF